MLIALYSFCEVHYKMIIPQVYVVREYELLYLKKMLKYKYEITIKLDRKLLSQETCSMLSPYLLRQ